MRIKYLTTREGRHLTDVFYTSPEGEPLYARFPGHYTLGEVVNLILYLREHAYAVS